KEKTGRNILIGSVELSLSPPELTLKDFTTSGENKKNFDLTITEIRARLEPLQALSGAIIIDDIEIKSPSLYLVANNDDMPIFPGFIQPKAPLKPRFFTTDIRKISITDGKIIAKMEGKASIDLKNFSLTLDRDKGKMSPLDINIQSGEVSYGKIKEPFSNLHINSFLSGRKLVINTVSINSKNVSLGGSGLIDFRQATNIKATLKGKVPSQRIMKYLGNAPPVTGDINIRANLSYNEKGWDVKSDMSINKGTIRQIPLKKLTANIVYASKKITLQSSFTFAESHFTLRGNLSPASGRYNVAGEIGKITLPWLKRANAVMADEFKVSMKGGGNLKKSSYRGTLSAGGTGQILEGEEKRAVEFDIKGDLGIEGQEIELSLTEDIEGTLKGRLSTKKESMLLAELFVNDLSDLSILLGYPLKGTAHINGEISGTILKPVFDGDLDFHQFAANGHSFERIWGHTNISKNLIESDNLKIEGKHSRINIEGSLALNPQPGINADVSIKNGKLSELMAMANLNYPAKGNIKGDFHVEGPLKS
ncbi:MAG: hypothetical protein IMF01_05085, partial [Proteobacteria bacterium]|nr:hypothetical protein [Pseudomonadota bacterium]